MKYYDFPYYKQMLKENLDQTVSSWLYHDCCSWYNIQWIGRRLWGRKTGDHWLGYGRGITGLYWPLIDVAHN